MCVYVLIVSKHERREKCETWHTVLGRKDISLLNGRERERGYSLPVWALAHEVTLLWMNMWKMVQKGCVVSMDKKRVATQCPHNSLAVIDHLIHWSPSSFAILDSLTLLAIPFSLSLAPILQECYFCVQLKGIKLHFIKWWQGNLWHQGSFAFSTIKDLSTYQTVFNHHSSLSQFAIVLTFCIPISLF